MKEFPTEEQADLFVLFISILIPLASLAVGLWLNSKTPKAQKPFLWFKTVFVALVGPIIRAFWSVYNSIENYYGLDSLRALEINFLIAIGISVVCVAVFSFFSRRFERPRLAAKRK